MVLQRDMKGSVSGLFSLCTSQSYILCNLRKVYSGDLTLCSVLINRCAVPHFLAARRKVEGDKKRHKRQCEWFVLPMCQSGISPEI